MEKLKLYRFFYLFINFAISGDEIEQLLDTLDNSVEIDIHRINCGHWEQRTPMFLLMDNFDQVDLLLDNKYFVRHHNIRLLELSSKSELIHQYQYDVWKKTWNMTKLIAFDLPGTLQGKNIQ